MIVGTWVWDGRGHHQVQDWSTALAQRDAEECGFVWISVDDPDTEEVEELGGKLGLHPLAIEDAVNGRQRPKFDQYDTSALMVVRPLDYVEETSDVITRELTLFLGPRYVVSIRRGGHTPLKDTRYRIDAQPDIMRTDTIGALHAALDAVVDSYAEVADALADDLDELEQEVFAEDPHSDVRTIYRLKREVQEARKAMVPLVGPVSDLASGAVAWVPKKARPFFRDVLDHLVRAADRIEGYERSLTDILNVHLTQVSVRQNEDARKISAWAAIIATPTLIAGVYGMNFKDIPELSLPYAYPVCLLVMLALCLSLYVGFRRSGWL